MQVKELFDLCLDAVDRYNRGEVYAEQPLVMLVLTRKTCPKGKGIRLYGRQGPLGDIANIKIRDDGAFDVCAYFPAIPILESLAQELGVTLPGS